MGNRATSIEEQIEILSERGMNFDVDSGKVKEILHDIGYYRLGFYWNPFEIDDHHNFKDNTNFSDVIKLYYLDVDLRNILIKYINRIEVNFRTNLVYYTSNKYKDSATWFINPEVVNRNYIEEFDNVYSLKFKRDNRQIKLHHQKYLNDKYAPAWKTLEFFTFGAILRIYKCLKSEDLKKRIAGRYNVLNIDKFVNLIGTIVYVRNSCAHGNAVFDLNTPKGISKLPGLNFNDNDRHSLDSTIKVIELILDKISTNRRVDLSNDLIEILHQFEPESVIGTIIQSKIGYRFPN